LRLHLVTGEHGAAISSPQSPQAYNSGMRRILLFLGSVATGVLTIVFSLVLLLVSLYLQGRHVVGVSSNQVVAWDPISLFSRVGLGVPLLLFGLGCGVGFWFLNKRLQPRQRVSAGS
jgi:hypothetical protein